MAYEVKLLDLAENDLDEICHYLSQFYPGTTGRFLDAFEKVLENISFNPKMYPKYRYNSEYRRFPINDFLGFYKIDEKSNFVFIFRILHGKRSITAILEKLKPGIN